MFRVVICDEKILESKIKILNLLVDNFAAFLPYHS
jgi:hypothetical protein